MSAIRPSSRRTRPGMRSRVTAGSILGCLVLGSLLLLSQSPSAETREWDSDTDQVVLVIPEEPGPWSWVPPTAGWKKLGIVKGASRYLTKLKTGAPATYEGGLIHLFVMPAPEGKTLDDLAADASVRNRLLARFDGAPELEVTDTTLNDDLPGKMLVAEGMARNRLGKPAAAQGRLLITLAHAKLYLLRMYAWVTEYDDEGLKVDLDYIEGEFMIKNPKEKPKTGKPKPGPGAGAPDGGGDPAVPVESKPEEIELREQLLRLTMDPKLTRIEPSGEGMLLAMAERDRSGWYQVFLYATKNGRYINGVAAPNADLKLWLTATWWKNFTANHPNGELWTYRWPKRIKAPTFITLPDLTEENRKRVTKAKKRPIEPKASDMEKMKIWQKVKRKLLGKKIKVSEAVRGVMGGNRPRTGDEVVLRFAWRSPFWSFKLVVTVGGKAYDKWGPALRRTLESIHHYKD